MTDGGQIEPGEMLVEISEQFRDSQPVSYFGVPAMGGVSGSDPEPL
jgi:hypothetical protein